METTKKQEVEEERVTAKISLKRPVIRFVKYLFVKRLAVTPFRPLGLSYGETTDKWLFEWQKMPGGYRWF